MMSLKDRVKNLGVAIKLAENREKGELEELLDRNITINNAEMVYLDTDGYVAFTVKEEKKKFYFGGKVLTQDLSTLLEEGYLDEIKKDGLPVLLTREKSRKTGNRYTKVTYL